MIPGAWSAAMRAGMEVSCDRCKVAAGQPCVSASGRVLTVTHAVRFRASSAVAPVRAYVGERMSWRWSA